GGFGGACGARVVVGRDRVQELRPRLRVERSRVLLDEPQPEMDMAEEAALLRLPEDGPAAELERPAGVVQERRREEQVDAEPRVDLGGGLDRADGELEAVAEALDAPEDADGVALAETAVEQLDVLPHAGVDAAARVDELEGEVRRPRLRPQSLLPCHAVHAFD